MGVHHHVRAGWPSSLYWSALVVPPAYRRRHVENSQESNYCVDRGKCRAIVRRGGAAETAVVGAWVAVRRRVPTGCEVPDTMTSTLAI